MWNSFSTILGVRDPRIMLWLCIEETGWPWARSVTSEGQLTCNRRWECWCLPVYLTDLPWRPTELMRRQYAPREREGGSALSRLSTSSPLLKIEPAQASRHIFKCFLSSSKTIRNSFPACSSCFLLCISAGCPTAQWAGVASSSSITAKCTARSSYFRLLALAAPKTAMPFLSQWLCFPLLREKRQRGRKALFFLPQNLSTLYNDLFPLIASVLT